VVSLVLQIEAKSRGQDEFRSNSRGYAASNRWMWKERLQLILRYSPGVLSFAKKGWGKSQRKKTYPGPHEYGWGRTAEMGMHGIGYRTTNDSVILNKTVCAVMFIHTMCANSSEFLWNTRQLWTAWLHCCRKGFCFLEIQQHMWWWNMTKNFKTQHSVLTMITMLWDMHTAFTMVPPSATCPNLLVKRRDDAQKEMESFL
jgi:hypothetical protein